MANRWGLWTYSIGDRSAIVVAHSAAEAREITASWRLPTEGGCKLGGGGPPARLVDVLESQTVEELRELYARGLFPLITFEHRVGIIVHRENQLANTPAGGDSE